MTLVDVVIPAYDRQHLLVEAIESVKRQTFSDWLLWIIDDASPEALHLPAGTDRRAEIRRLATNRGPAYARNFGAALGNAPYIAFLDSDDLWHPQKLEQAIAAFTHNPGLNWWHSNELWLRNGKTVKQKSIHRKQGGQFFERALERCLISPSAVVLRRSFFLAEHGFASAFRLCEDYELWLRLLLRAPIGYCDTPLTIKRAGDWPQLSSTREMDRYRVLAMHRLWRQKKTFIPAHWQQALLSECIKKSTLLLAGAKKHGKQHRVRCYQAWLTLFQTLRTRAMRCSG